MMFECINKVYPSVSIDTVTGAICSFSDNIGGLPLKSCVSQISGYQEGSGTPSPSNVRPLHAFSSADLYFNTINQWDEQWESGTYNWNTGKKLVNSTYIRNKNMIRITEGKTYYFLSPKPYNIFFYNENGEFIEPIYKAVSGEFSHATASYINFSLSNISVYNNDISINYPATDTSYHAFSGAVFTFGQSIYQGSIDWKRGVVVATWGYIASYNGETLTGEWLCNKAPYEVGNTPPTGSQVAYELATPIEIPLGGVNLITQQGQNNIYCDTGDTTVEYIKIV